MVEKTIIVTINVSLLMGFALSWTGRRISNKKEELRELVEHFNVSLTLFMSPINRKTSISKFNMMLLQYFQIDVENPCVIMSQDKSREFLQSGNAKDKFKVKFYIQKLIVRFQFHTFLSWSG